MEDKIFEIIDSHTKEEGYYGEMVTYKTGAAKEIASHFREFIEWLSEELNSGNMGYNKTHSIYWFYENNLNTDYTLDELYNYWMKEVKK